MTVRLLSPWWINGDIAPAGAVVSLAPATEAGLIAQGLAESTAAPVDWAPRTMPGAQQTVSVVRCQWSDRPSPNGVPVGTEIIITDLLNRPRFFNDGTNWIPVGGMLTLRAHSGSVTTPVAQGTRVSGAAFLLGLPGGSVRIPGGLLIPGRSQIAVTGLWSKLGAAAGMNCVTTIGTTNSFADSQTTNQFIGGAATSIWNQDVRYSVAEQGRIQVTDTIAANASAGVTANREFTTSINTTQDMWINAGSTSGTDGDGMALVRFRVDVFS